MTTDEAQELLSAWAQSEDTLDSNWVCTDLQNLEDDSAYLFAWTYEAQTGGPGYDAGDEVFGRISVHGDVVVDGLK